MERLLTTEIVDFEISLIEAELEKFNRHAIKTQTLKSRCLNHISLDSNNDETAYCAKIGFDQVVQSRLNQHEYRSIGRGNFVNLEKCTDANYLAVMLKEAQLTVDEKTSVRNRIKKLCDGQGEMSFNEDGSVDIGFNLTENEFWAKVEKDAI